MQQQAIVPPYGMSKTEYARRVQEQAVRTTAQPSNGFFTRLRKKFR